MASDYFYFFHLIELRFNDALKYWFQFPSDGSLLVELGLFPPAFHWNARESGKPTIIGAIDENVQQLLVERTINWFERKFHFFSRKYLNCRLVPFTEMAGKMKQENEIIKKKKNEEKKNYVIMIIELQSSKNWNEK